MPAKRRPAKPAKPSKPSKPAGAATGRTPPPGTSGFDVDKLLAAVDSWCRAQPHHARLVRGAPLTDDEIDRIPVLPTEFRFALATPYDPAQFTIPDGYRALLRRAGGVHVEITQDGKPEIWPVFHIFRPGPCKDAQCGGRYTLCDSWTTAGATVDDREFTTTNLISFASMGYSVEASRWCFHIADRPPSIYEESNDYECLAGTYVDTGEPLSNIFTPVFTCFERWFTTLVEIVTAHPLALDRDGTVRAIYEAGDWRAR